MSNRWPESAVAVTLILLIAAVSVAGIARYEVADFLKIWAALTGLVGIITGTVVTYFFTRASVDNAERKLSETQRKLEDEREQTRALLSDRLVPRSSEGRLPDFSPREDVIKEWATGNQRRSPS